MLSTARCPAKWLRHITPWNPPNGVTGKSAEEKGCGEDEEGTGGQTCGDRRLDFAWRDTIDHTDVPL